MAEFLANCLHGLEALGPGGLWAVMGALFLAGLAGGASHCAAMCGPFVLAQSRQEMVLEIMGHQGLGWEGEAFTSAEIEAVRSWLSGRAMSIYGGSVEVQNNIISKRILGLPDTTQSA